MAEQLALDRPFYPSDSPVRKIARENLVLLVGGQKAFLEQAAHPVVVQGAVDHSRFPREPVERLISTVTAVDTITFGTRRDAMAVFRGVNRAHRAVQGTHDYDIGIYRKGQPYKVDDPSR